MDLKDRVSKTVEYVEQYYHKHKRDTVKPRIWDLIVTIRYLSHENRSVTKFPRFKCAVKSCEEVPVVITFGSTKMLLCLYHAQYYGFCPTCGYSYEDPLNFCTYCTVSEDERDRMLRNYDFEVDDYDKDFKNSER